MKVLQDKRIIVTGAGSGIGAAVAGYLAREGATMVLADIDEAAAERTAASLREQGLCAIAHWVDVSSWEACAALVRHALRLHGRIDGLAAFAGVLYLAKPWEESDGARARRLIEVNLLGAYYLGALVLAQMQRQGFGAIVNVTSGAQAGQASSAAYSASKAGVAGLTYSWAMDAAAHGVRVNALSPVATTPMTRLTDEYLRERGQLQGQRPFVDPLGNAPAVAFLLSDLAKDVNGQVLRVHEKHLQLMSHPAVSLPEMTREQWDAVAVGEALAATFPQGLPPLGVCGVEARYKPLAKTHQVPR